MSAAETQAPRLARAGLSRFAGAGFWAGVALVVLIAAAAVLSPVLQTHNPTEVDLAQRFRQAGEAGYILGTDHLGRDLWSRAIAGLGWSTACALIATVLASALGIALGLIAAERDGWARVIVRQATDTVIAFPGIVVAICVIAVMGQGFWPLTLTLGFLSWPVFARVTFAEASSVMARDYVRAASLLGVSRLGVLWGHVLPALRPTLMVLAAFHFADMLIAESALSFLGIGAPVGAPTWGNMLAESRSFLFLAPSMMLVPSAFIVGAVIALNLLGDGLAAAARRAEGGA